MIKKSKFLKNLLAGSEDQYDASAVGVAAGTPQGGDITVPDGRRIGCVAIVPERSKRETVRRRCNHREGRSKVNNEDPNGFLREVAAGSRLPLEIYQRKQCRLALHVLDAGDPRALG